MPIFDPKFESAGRELLRQIQLERLQASVNRIYRHVPFYHELFGRAGLQPEDLRSLDDLARLPLTSRDDLLGHQPYGLFAVPLHDVLRLHPAAGAGGPVVVGHTRNDLAAWTRMAARALASAGVMRTDVVQITLDYGSDPAAFGTQAGAEALGASVIPCSGVAPERQAEVMRAYRATVLAATPAQALQIGRVLAGAPAGDLSLRTVLVVGEVWSQELRQEIEAALGVPAFANYGMSEMTVPGLAAECERHAGLHLSEDNFLAEIIDPATGRPLPEGEKGELVLTTLTREAAPLLRYRTGDLTALHRDPCACGRTHARIEPTHARADALLLVNGVRVDPAQVQAIVHDLMPGAQAEVAVARRDGLEEIEVRLAIHPSSFGHEIRDLEAKREHVRLHVLERLGVAAAVRLVEPPRRTRG